MNKQSHGAKRSKVLSEVCVGGTAPVDRREHIAVVVPRKHLNREVASEWVPDLVPESCPRGNVSSRRNEECSTTLGSDESPTLLGNDESGGR